MTQRLDFRELGLSIGLHGIARLRNDFEGDEEARRRLESLESYVPLAGRIESTWCEEDNRRVRTWTDHVGINSVMLATSLSPDGFLDPG